MTAPAKKKKKPVQAPLSGVKRTILDVGRALPQHDAGGARSSSPPVPPPSAMVGLEKLARYGLSCLREYREHFGDLDGCWLQDEAERLGLLIQTKVAGSCCDTCRCTEYGDFPQECYRLSPDVKAAAECYEPAPTQGAEGARKERT